LHGSCGYTSKPERHALPRETGNQGLDTDLSEFYPDPALIALKQLDLLVSLIHAREQLERRLLAWLEFVPSQPPQIQLHLALVTSLELARFQVHIDQLNFKQMG
jgi:hypothetical protein